MDYKLYAFIMFIEAINILLMIGQYIAISRDIENTRHDIRKLKNKIRKNMKRWLKNGTD